jgi:transcriptional regulator with XRE-family HTH domain
MPLSNATSRGVSVSFRRLSGLTEGLRGAVVRVDGRFFSFLTVFLLMIYSIEGLYVIQSDITKAYTMPKKTASRRTTVSKALIELRRRLNETQQSMSQRLGVSLQAVARWETSSPPVNIVLANLHGICVSNGYSDLALVFMNALESLKDKQRRKLDDIIDEINRWHAIREHLDQLCGEAERLRNEKLKDSEMPQRIEDRLLAFAKTLSEAQKWSWRNR